MKGKAHIVYILYSDESKDKDLIMGLLLMHSHASSILILQMAEKLSKEQLD